MHENQESIAVKTKQLVKDFFLSKEEVVHVLKGVDMQVKPGEFIGVMGPSGSGKSTLLNILSTLETLTDGDVFVAGISLNEINTKKQLEIRRKKSSIVFQNFALIPYLTAKENVKLPLKLRGIPEIEAEEKAVKFLEQVGLELSGGEQQRVAIARALAHEPAIIYADEPTGNLDTHIGKEIIYLFKDLAKNHNITVIMVTHDPESAKETDRIYILQKGKVFEEKVTSLKKRSSKKKGGKE
ncbi:MAG: ABC transporter ATP-binding protein [Candidatus Heimdallarchaeaceae archaeon]